MWSWQSSGIQLKIFQINQYLILEIFPILQWLAHKTISKFLLNLGKDTELRWSIVLFSYKSFNVQKYQKS